MNWMKLNFSNKDSKLTWNDISIKQYYYIKQVLENDSTFKLEKDIDIISFLSGIPIEKLDNMKVLQINKLADKFLSFIYDSKLEGTNKVKNYYQIGNRRYKCKSDARKLLQGQLIDLENKLATTPNDIAGLLSIIMIPVGREYNKGYDLEEVKKGIEENFSITDALSLCFFFLNQHQYYTMITAGCSIRKINMMIKKETDEKKKENLITMKNRISESVMDGVGLS